MTLRTDISGSDNQTDHATQHNEGNQAILDLQTMSVNAQTGTTYAVALSDKNKLVTLSNSSSITVTLPKNVTVAFPVGGSVLFMQLGAGTVTFAAESGATLVFESAFSAASRAQYAAITAVKSATNTWWLFGALADA